MEVRAARPEEAENLSFLAMRSKAHWGYSEGFMKSCVEELSHCPEDIVNPAYSYGVLEHNSKVCGFYKLIPLEDNILELEALFVEPQYIGQGFGKLLLNHALKCAKEIGANYVEAQSDPQAEDFYLKSGASRVGYEPSGSIAGRMLPVVRFNLI